MNFPKNQTRHLRTAKRKNLHRADRRAFLRQLSRADRRCEQQSSTACDMTSSTRKVPNWEVETARAMLTETNSLMRKIATKGIEHWDLRPHELSIFQEMLGAVKAPNTLASNTDARTLAGDALIEYLLDVHSKHPRRRFYHLTFIDDRARTSDRSTLVDLAPLVARVRKLTDQFKIANWLAVIELEAHTNSKRGKGRAIVPHVHLLTWTAKKIKIRKLEKALCSSRRLISATRAKTVKVSRRQSRPGEIAHAAAYLLKGPVVAKNLMRRRDDPTRHTQRGSRIPKVLAVRLTEILSQMKLSELIISSGTGLNAKRRILDAINGQLKPAGLPCPISDKDAGIHWKRWRRRAGKESYLPVVVRRRSKN